MNRKYSRHHKPHPVLSLPVDKILSKRNEQVAKTKYCSIVRCSIEHPASSQENRVTSGRSIEFLSSALREHDEPTNKAQTANHHLAHYLMALNKRAAHIQVQSNKDLRRVQSKAHVIAQSQNRNQNCHKGLLRLIICSLVLLYFYESIKNVQLFVGAAGDHARATTTNKSAQLDKKLKPAKNQQLPAGRKSSFYLQVAADQATQNQDEPDGLQISITPRVAIIRLPVESNTILKCLISAQTNKFAKKFLVHWSRFMYDEKVYEQLDTSIPSIVNPVGRKKVEPMTRRIGLSEQGAVDTEGSEKIFDRQQQLRNFLSRSRQETKTISDMLIEATLSISSVKTSDNATYYCTATDGSSQENQASIDLVVLSRPVVQLERVQPARDSKSAIVHWMVISDGNTPIKKTILMVRNDTSQMGTSVGRARGFESLQEDLMERPSFSTVVTDSDLNQWQRIDIHDQQANKNAPAVIHEVDSRADVDVTSSAAQSQSSYQVDFYASSQWPESQTAGQPSARQRYFNLSSLLPGVTYNLRLAAINDMGQSNWSQLITTMPNDIPAQINEVFLLSRSNDSLNIGWRRPSYDTAKTIRYEMQLFDLNRTLTFAANTNISDLSTRTNFMYFFFNLSPGTDYHFHVRACSKLGCSGFSSPKLSASTLDGEPDEPLEVELTCRNQAGAIMSVSWQPPINARGLLLNYTILYDAYARYRNQSGHWTVDEWRVSMETPNNETLNWDQPEVLRPNTNYTVRVCANNRSKQCGRLSSLSSRTQCFSPPELPYEIPPGLELKRKTITISMEGEPPVDRELLALDLPRISWRNGSIDCIQIVLIRLPKAFEQSSLLTQYLPTQPSDIRLSEWTKINETKREFSTSYVAYLAEEVDQMNLLPPVNDLYSGTSTQSTQEIQLGEGLQQQCRSIRNLSLAVMPIDGQLQPDTYYTGFIKLTMARPKPTLDGRQVGSESEWEVLSKYSNYFNLVRTGAQVVKASFVTNDTSNLEAFGIEFQTKNLQKLASALGSGIQTRWLKFYNASTKYVTDSVGLEALSNYLMASSPLMQLLEVGIFVLVVSLLLLLLIYLVSLPKSVRRKRKRKKQQKLSKQSKEPEKAMPGAQTATTGTCSVNGEALMAPSMNGVTMGGRTGTIYHQQLEVQDVIEVESDGSIRQTVCPSNAQHIQDCPVHSSPMSRAGRAHGPNCQSHIESLPSLHKHHHQYVSQHQHYHPAYSHTLHHHHHHHGQAIHQDPTYTTSQEQYERNCRTVRRTTANGGLLAQNLTLGHQNSVLALAKKISKPIPLRLFGQVFEVRLRSGWLRDEYEQLPRQQFEPPVQTELAADQGTQPRPLLKLRPQLMVSRSDSVSALISGNDHFDANLVKLPQEKRIICAKSPLDADSVWDFWRLVYEQDVNTIVMLSQNEDPNTGEIRCAQYWPTCDNEETTILSPCNEFVQKSTILPAKFKIRQETLEEESKEDDYQIRRLTLMVMATRAGENDQDSNSGQTDKEQDSERLVIVERNILHIQFYHWNTSTLANQMRLVNFIELANKRHANQEPQESPTDSLGLMMVHCFNGLGRSGLFTAMSVILDQLASPLENSDERKLNIFQIVSRLRAQREMLLSPYRLYELTYQLCSNCIPAGEFVELGRIGS